MLGRLKSRMRRTASDGDQLNSSQRSQGSQTSNGGSRGRAVPAVPMPDHSFHDFNAKLTGLASFDACVEACDALAASSSYAKSSITRDKRTGLNDCSVIVSPDGDLLLLPTLPGPAPEESKITIDKAPPTIDENEQDTSDEKDEKKDEKEKDGKDDDAKQPEPIRRKRPPMPSFEMRKSILSSLNEDHDYFTELRNVGDYATSVVMGNDLKQGGDKSINGFSAMGWSLAASSLAIRQTEGMMRDMTDFVEELILGQKEGAARVSLACDQLRAAARIGVVGQDTPTPKIPSPPVPTSVRNSGQFSPKQRRGSTVDLNSLSELEPAGSTWKATYANSNSSNALDSFPMRVGPLLYPGNSLHNATIAFEEYHSMMAEGDANRWRKASLSTGILPKLRKEADLMADRSFHREKALKLMQRKADDVEMRLVHCKEEAKKRWKAVHQAEEKVTKIVEERMLERSRQREKRRLEQLREEQALNDKDRVEFGATAGEIWEIVSAVAESMEDGSFTPIGLPQAPISGPRDQSSDNVGLPNVGQPTPPVSSPPQEELPMASRVEIEQECRLPQLRAAAMAADEAVEDAAQNLLNVLSTLDTTRRSARVAAETSLLSACNAHAACIRSLVELERASLLDRLDHIRELERLASKIDVRADLDTYVSADRKDRGGSTWLGDHDDGGIASALAVLSSHVDGSTGIFASRGRVDSEGWISSRDLMQENDISSESIEDSVDEIFEENKFLLPSAQEDDEKTKEAREKYEDTVQLLCKVAVDFKSSAARSRRSAVCYALNSKRAEAEIKSEMQFDALCRLFDAILTGCDGDSSGVANAKMCMMLAQTFYIVNDGEESKDSAASGAGKRSNRIYVRNRVGKHPLWADEEFWDQALHQCVTESLTHSGVMGNFERISGHSERSEWTETQKMKWYDLNHMERSEAASQVHAVVFAQLGALAHSMMEFGCGIERACAFVRRMSVRNQLPISQRTMLLQHLMSNKNDK